METYKGGIPPFYLYYGLRSGAWKVGIKTTKEQCQKILCYLIKVSTLLSKVRFLASF